MKRSRWLLRILAPLTALTTALAFAPPAAQAAVPDRVAFVLYNGGTVVPSGTNISGTSVTIIGVGRYQIKFPGKGITGGVAHITAINPVGHWCQLETWFPAGSDEMVNVRCYKFGGIPDPTAFSAIFYASSGPGSFGPYGYVDSQPTGLLVSNYNSAGALNNVVRLNAGIWQVTLPALGTPGPRDGSIQVTAVNSTTGARCNVVSWNSSPAQQQAIIHCFSIGGGLMDTRFTMTFQYQSSLYGPAIPPKYFGYLWFAPGAGAVTTNFNSQLGVSANSFGASPGGFSVKFPNIGFFQDNIQVTTYGTASNWCSLSAPWTHTGTTTLAQVVNCFNLNGSPVTNGFLISDNSIL